MLTTRSSNKEHAPVPVLQNIVSTFSMGANQLNLAEITMRVPFMEFNAKRFAAGVLRLTNPRTTCLLFASGKGVCTGAKTEQSSRLAATKFVCLLNRCGIDVSFNNFSIQNVVAAVHCPWRLDLDQMINHVQGFASYEPELFPGLMYRVRLGTKEKITTIVFLCFQSGKCVITGGKSQDQILSQWTTFYSTVLCKFKIVPSGDQHSSPEIRDDLAACRMMQDVDDDSHSTSAPYGDTDAKRWLIQELMHTTTMHSDTPPSVTDQPIAPSQAILSTEIQLVNSMHDHIQSVDHTELLNGNIDNNDNTSRSNKRLRFSPTAYKQD